MASWKNAAERYRANRPEVIAARQQEEIDWAVCALVDFLASGEGASAKDLLSASDRFIRVGEQSDGGDRTRLVFIMNKDGLYVSAEPAGTGSAYEELQGDPHRSTLAPMSIQEFVRAVATAKTERRAPADILPYIRKTLDEIAEQAPPAKR